MIRTLAGSIRQYKKQTILSPVTVALEVVMEIIIPLLMAMLIIFAVMIALSMINILMNR